MSYVKHIVFPADGQGAAAEGLAEVGRLLHHGRSDLAQKHFWPEMNTETNCPLLFVPEGDQWIDSSRPPYGERSGERAHE
jgi:hypothetical protein